MLIVAMVLFVLALLVGGVAVAALTGRLPRNRFAGVRTPESLRSDENFALANKVAAPTQLAAALILVAGGVGALVLPTVAGIVGAVVTIVGAVLVAGYGGSAGAKVAAAQPVEDTGACGSACGACSLKGACESSQV